MKPPKPKVHKMILPSKIAQTRANIASKEERNINIKNPVIKTKRIPLSAIEVNPARQPRVKIDTEHVERIREAYENGDTVTPIEVFSETGEAPFFLSNGFHRFEAAMLLTFKDLEAVIHPGTQFDAFLKSLSANVGQNSLPLTNADKNRAVTLALSDPKISTYSDNRIAEICGVSQAFVSKVRRQMESQPKTVLGSNANSSPKTPKEPKKTVGKDGKARSAPKRKETEKKEDEKENSVEIGFEEIVKDANEEEVPKTIAADWLRATKEAIENMGLASKIKSWLDKGIGVDPMFSELNHAIVSELTLIYRKIKTVKPYILCPDCHGKKCKTCHKRGWISEFYSKQLGK